MIRKVNFEAPEWDMGEILRYSGCKYPEPEVIRLAEECIHEVSDRLVYKVCYDEFPIAWGERLQFGNISTSSNTLKKVLSGCDSVLIFAATVGIELDRMIKRYGYTSPSKALMLQAIGAERVESLCNTFCGETASRLSADGRFLKPRVSAGYGDIPLSMQKNFFALLDCPHQIGLALCGSLMMSPSKSVTAMVGITSDGKACNQEKCAGCNKTDCDFRR